jgi:anaerobic nitric oxide reductase transcription regulator
MSKPLVLIVDDDPEVSRALERTLGRAGYRTLAAADVEEAREALAVNEVDLLLVDLVLPSGSGMELITRARMRDADLAVIVLTGHGSVASAVEAMRVGAYDYLTKPVNPDELLLQIERALENRRLRRDLESLRGRLDERLGGEGIIAVSAPMKRIFEMVEQLARTDITVLITGPSGSGKELVADAIQHRGNRRDGPYVKLHCAALSEGLLESELFGHVRGAFTGASADRPGKLEVANHGTLFLDEVGELPLSVQPKLLRAIQAGEIQRVGSDTLIKADVRLIAATNRDLEQEVTAGRFRADLFHRLNVYPLRVPPLRERADDIPLLSGYFCDVARRRLGLGPVRLDPEAVAALKTYPWPGNVRELENVLSRVTLKAASRVPRGQPVVLTRQSLGPDFAGPAVAGVAPQRAQEQAREASAVVGLKEATREYQRSLIERALAAHGGNWSAAARSLGMHRSNFHHLAVRLGLK